MKTKIKNVLDKIKNSFNDNLSKFKSLIKQKLEPLKPKIDVLKNFFINMAEKLHLKQIYHFTRLDKLVNKLKSTDKKVYFDLIKKTFILIFIPILILSMARTKMLHMAPTVPELLLLPIMVLA